MAIIFDKVSYTYEAGTALAYPALFDVSLTIPEQKITAIIGQTGSGKSTLAQHLNGLLIPTEGQVEVDRFVVTPTTKQKALFELRRHIGMVFQLPETQLFATSVIEDVMFAPKNFGSNDEQARQQAEAALREVKLDESLWERSPFDLSGGQMRRVAIAGVIAASVDVIVFDEPTVGLDPEGAADILAILKHLQKTGKTIIMISHDMDAVAELADQVIIMANGRLAAQGTPRQIFTDTKLIESTGLLLPKATQFAAAHQLTGQLPTTIKQLVQRLVKRQAGERS